MIDSLIRIFPEIAVGVLAMAVLVLSPFAKREKRSLAYLSIGGTALILLSTLVWGWRFQGPAFDRMVIIDSYTNFFRIIFGLTALFVLIMSIDYAKYFSARQGEYYALILFALLGMMLLPASGNFLTLFLSLELMSLSFYILSAYMRKHPKSVEAGLKYLILGGLSTGTLLYGISFLYGVTGSVDFAQVTQWITARGKIDPVILVGALLIIVALSFKIASFPFHIWVPDVYEGSPTPVTAFLSVGSKAAGFAVLVRLLVSALAPLKETWIFLIALFAAATLLYGNLAAIPQKNIKRLLGYSSIGQAGYLLVGLAAANTLGISAILFYLLAYLFSNIAAFMVIVIFSNVTQSDAIEDYTGLSRRSPLLAVAMSLGLLSLAGVPPLAGFFGKFILLGAAVKEGLFWLVFIGAACIVVSLYYYLLIIKQMYLGEIKDQRPLEISPLARMALYACMAGILAVGIYPSPFLDMAMAASKILF
ncbi:MAG TPA: NADH-quinone oxidoreductase subunit N [Candidatus Manganitrophaceae bacterium]|nr:NADH-quinone oxidoreductase subunit N [Candidatus Manganitrophaceae bacterium]